MIIEGITDAIQDSMVLETKAINQEVATQTIDLGSTSQIFNNNTYFSNYGKRFIQPYEQTFPQQNTYRNNEPNLEQQSPSPQQPQQPQQGASFYTPCRNNNLQQRQSKPNNIQQQPNQISFVEGDDDYVNAITDFFQTIEVSERY